MKPAQLQSSVQNQGASPSDRSSCAKRWRERTAPHVFFQQPERKAWRDSWKEVGEERCERLIALADEAVAHRFDLLGSGLKDLGPTIDWHRDFISGERWELVPIAQVPTVKDVPGADIKIPWELSRFYHAPVLGIAYLLTDDERYAREFTEQIRHWIKENPVGHGANWVCGMEAAIRAANWLVTLPYVMCSAALDDDFLWELRASLLQHGQHIRSHLEGTVHLRSNHYLADLQGLLYLGILMPDFKESAEWVSFAKAELEREMDWEVYQDGTDFEASTSYHRLCLELMLGPAILCRANDITLSPAFWQRLHDMFLAIRGLIDESGRIQLIGDNDSGRLHVLARRSDDDLRYLLPIGALLFDDHRLCMVGSPYSEEAMLMMGPSGQRIYQVMRLHPICQTSTAFPDSGWYQIRQFRETLHLTCGPNGQRFRDPPAGHPSWNGGHAHNDKLSLSYTVDERQVLIDPGQYCYTSDGKERNRWRSTASHNTLQVDGLEQQTLRSDYLFNIHDDRAKPKVTLWNPESAGDALFIGEHHGFVEEARIVHERRVSRREGGGFVIDDQLSPAGEADGRSHSLTIWFHAAEGIQIQEENPRAWRFGDSAWLLLPSDIPIECKINDDFVSPAYGVRKPSKTLSIHAQFRAPCRFTWNLVPIRKKSVRAAPSFQSSPPAKVASGQWPTGLKELQPQSCVSLSASAMLRGVATRAKNLKQQNGSYQPVLVLPDGQNPSSILYSRLDFWNLASRAGGSLGHTSNIIRGFASRGSRVFVISGVKPPMIDPQDHPMLLVRGPKQPWTVEHHEHQYFAADEALEAGFSAFADKTQPAFIYERIVIGSSVAVRVARRMRIPYVVEYNGSEIWVQRHWAKSPMHHEALFTEVESAVLESADLVVVVSEPLRQELLDRGIADQKILVNPNAVDPDEFDPDKLMEERAQVRGKFGIAETDFVVGFIGTFGAWHGIPTLAKAIPGLLDLSKRMKLLLIGDGSMRKIIEDVVRKHQCADRVKITGIVGQDEAPSYLAACDLFLSPHQTPPNDSRPFFGSPTKLFEYLAMGRPTIASDFGQIGHILKNSLRISDIAKADPTACEASGVLVKPGDPEELISAVREIFLRPDLGERLAKNGRALVREGHTWSRHVERIIARLRELCIIASSRDRLEAAQIPYVAPVAAPQHIQLHPVEIPPLEHWMVCVASWQENGTVIESQKTKFDYILKSPTFTVQSSGSYRLIFEGTFLKEATVTYGIQDANSETWVSNDNVTAGTAMRHSHIFDLKANYPYFLVLANARAKAAVTAIRNPRFSMEHLIEDERNEDIKQETRRQWNLDYCGGERGGSTIQGSMEWFLNIEQDRYCKYAPWMPKAIGFDRYKGKKLLEIGGGLGTDLSQFAKAGAIVTDFDLAEGHLGMAKRNFALRGLQGEFILGDAEELPFEDGYFDVVYSFGVIHHTPKTEQVVEHIHRVLKPGGEAIVMVYAKHSWNYWYKDFYQFYLRKKFYKTMTMADVLSSFTEHNPNGAKPLVKVYTAKECKAMFSRFSKVTVRKYQLGAQEIPLWMRCILPVSVWGRIMGWNLLIHAVK